MYHCGLKLKYFEYLTASADIIQHFNLKSQGEINHGSSAKEPVVQKSSVHLNYVVYAVLL